MLFFFFSARLFLVYYMKSWYSNCTADRARQYCAAPNYMDYFYEDSDCRITLIMVQLAPWSRWLLHLWLLSLLGGFKKAATAIGKNSNESTGKLDHMILLSRPGAPGEGGISGPYPQTRNVSPSEDCAPQISNRLGATGVHFGACAPQSTASAPPPPSVSKVSIQDEKHEWMPRWNLRFCAKDLLFFVFTVEFVGKGRDPHHKIASRPARLWTCPSRRALCSKSRQMTPIHRA